MKNVPLATLIVALCFSCLAFCEQIDSTPWTNANIAKLDQADKASVADFMNRSRDPGLAIHPYDITQFGWVDLAGNGNCELVVTTYYPGVSWATIYWRDAVNGFSSQMLLGEVSIKSGLKDLNGDGKKEIIVYSYLDPAGRRGANPTPYWPEVYRLEGQKYVPASKNFPDFYKLEILPKLDREIGKTPYPGERAVAALEMQRDKIRRVLGLDPDAGLEKAQQWVKSDDPELIQDARNVFHDIPGHEAEAKAAEKAWKQAARRQTANPSK